MWSRVLRFSRTIGFTKGETSAILFLAVATLAGGAIRLLSGDQRTVVPLSESYHAHDSAFAARAAGTPGDSAASAPSVNEAGIAATETEKRPGSSGAKTEQLAGRRININKAATSQLQLLPGVGESTAQRIVEYRNASGPFRRIEDIMNVKSIGEKKFEKMKPYICVSE